MKNNKHYFWMLIGCTLPFLLIFLAPAFGIGSNISFFIFILLLFGCHLMMMNRHHRHHQHHEEYDNETHQH